MQQEPQRRRLAWCPEDSYTMSNLLQDSGDLFRPDERFVILIVDSDKIYDCREEFRDAAETPPLVLGTT